MSVCVVTGASSGIGRCIARKIIQEHQYSDVVLVARNREQLIETARIETAGVVVHVMPFDLRNLTMIPTFVEEIRKIGEGISALVNVSGYTRPASLFDTTQENMYDTFSLNVFSVLEITREVAKYMKESGGKIINIASTAGSSARPGWLSYAASKAAVISMSRTLSVELAEYHIKVYCVSPGRCATPLRRILAPDEDQTKIMQPAAVADVVWMLLTPLGDHLDGQDLIVR